MKKLTVILSALLIACLAATACAEIPSSDVYKPVVSETYKALVGGKTFEARINGVESFGEDEDAKVMVSITVCEETHFEADVIEKLKAGDILVFAPGKATMVMEVATDEFGTSIKGGNDEGYYFIKADDGCYAVRTDTENIVYTEVFTVKVLLEKDVRFLDWSDPENLDEPVKKGYDELIDLLLEDTNFSPYNTKVTFDENGKLVEFLYTYSPWN